MDTPSLIAAVMPITTLIALITGIALPFIAGSRPGRGHPPGRPARADEPKPADAAGRKTRPRKPGADDAAPAGYLYLPCARNPHHGYPAQTRRRVQQVPIIKKTAKLIYYASDSWDRSQAVISPGCISREHFETDTRCHHDCPRDIAVGLVCAPHRRGHRHCVHVLTPGPHCRAPGGCGQDCPADTPGARCAPHGYTWEHCPHGHDRCHHGYPAGVIPVPGDRPGPAGRLFFATRQAAEDHLHRQDRGPARQPAPQPPSIKELRRAMAQAHPDRGGTAAQFTQAHRRYHTALGLARR